MLAEAPDQTIPAAGGVDQFLREVEDFEDDRSPTTRDGDLEERVASLESDFEDLVEDVGTVVERLEEVRDEVGVGGSQEIK